MAEKAVTEARVKELIAEALKGFLSPEQIAKTVEAAIGELATKEDVRMIVDNLQNFITRDALAELTSELVTKDQWNEALEAVISPAVHLSGIRPELELDESQSSLIPEEYLTGLVYRYAERHEDENGDGGRTVRNVAKERTLTPDDVLSWKDNGSTISIVTTDGKKHIVEKE